MPIGDLPDGSSSISFNQIQAAYNEIHETNLSNPISLSEFNGKFLDNSHTAIAISSGNAYALGTLRGRHFAVGSYSSSHVIGELTEPGSGTQYLHGQLTGGTKSARIKVSVDNASDTFKVYLQNVVGHGSASLDCRMGLIQVHSGAETVLFANGDTDPEVIQYKPSTGVLHVMSGPTASAGSGNLISDVDDISGWSGSATTFHVVVNGLDSSQTGVFHVYRIPDVAAGSGGGGGGSSSNATYWLYLHDTGGNGGGGVFELAPTGTTDLLTPTDLGNFAHSDGNGGSALTISSNAAQLADGAGYDYDDMNTELPCFSYSLPVPDSGSTTVYDLLPYDDGGAGGDSYEFRWGIAPENGGMLQFGGIGGPENSDLFSDVRSATASFWGGSGKVITLTLSPDGSGAIGTRD